MSIHTPNSTFKLPHLHMIRVPGGTFEMGSEWVSAYRNEKPLRSVTVSDFELAAFAVTQALWEAVMGEGSNPSRFEGPRRPVERISCYDAVAFCNRMNALEKLPFCYFFDEKCTRPYALEGELPNAGPVFYKPAVGAFRLPSEIEREYVVRGGPFHTAKLYYDSHRLKDIAWYGDSSSDESQPVGLMQPNALGLYDMSGNVNEWCWDMYGDYEQTIQSNPSGLVESPSGVVIVEFWDFAYHGIERKSYRGYHYPPDYRNDYFGFRLARHFTL